MLFKCLNVILVLLMSLAFAGLQAKAQSKSEPLRIQSVMYNAGNQSIGLIAQDGVQYGKEFNMVRLNHPDRVVIDIPNAFLSTPIRNIPIHQNGIERVELTQSLGAYYQVVRLTVFATEPDAISNIQVQPNSNTLFVTINPPTVSEQGLLQPPLPSRGNTQHSFLDQAPPPALNVIKSASFEKGTLTITADTSNTLVVKNQFTLKEPNRLVIDLANSVLADKHLSTPIDVKGDSRVNSIRLGQFEEDTVRIVVETERPSGIYIVYPGEGKNQIALTTQFTQSVRTLPIENQKVGFINDIKLFKKDDNSIIRIHTSDPMVRRLTRHPGHIEIELLNIASRPSIVAFDKQEFSEIREIRLNQLNPAEPNTKVIVRLDNPDVDMESHLSMDGRYLELMLMPRDSQSARHHQRQGHPNTAIDLTRVKQGLYTVVVDAGHGGKDQGANRDGVYEKHLNLIVALKLKRSLEARGVRVHMTRSSDTFLELSQIVGITNHIRPDAFVSVHTNASVKSEPRGLETYYYTPQSRDLAQRVHRKLVNNINSPDRGVRTARFYVIHHTSVPAILCEMGYISNPTERIELQTEARQNATAEAIAEGVVEFLQRRYKAEAAQGEEF